jgi:uncharacterized protein
MKARIHVITLAVADFDRALAFYRALGLQSAGVTATEFAGDDTHPAGAIVMFHLDGGQILALYPRSELAKDAGIAPGPARSGEFSLGHIVPSRQDVDARLRRLEHPSLNCTTDPGASTPVTFATRMDICGKSSTIQTTPKAALERGSLTVMSRALV